MKIQVIIGTTRPNRFSEIPANWIYQELKKIEGIEAELVDLRDYNLPFFDEPKSPTAAGIGGYTAEAVVRWTKKVAEADGYIIVTGEYNHGYPAVLKNALDYVYFEWNKKPVGFISYGSVSGARVIEQLRQVVVELQLVPVKNSIHIPGQVVMAIKKGEGGENPFESLNAQKDSFITNLVWWVKALKVAREADKN